MGTALAHGLDRPARNALRAGRCGIGTGAERPGRGPGGAAGLVGPDGGIARARTGEVRPFDGLAVSSCTRGLQMVTAGPADGVPGLDEVTPGEAMRAGCAA